MHMHMHMHMHMDMHMHMHMHSAREGVGGELLVAKRVDELEDRALLDPDPSPREHHSERVRVVALRVAGRQRAASDGFHAAQVTDDRRPPHGAAEGVAVADVRRGSRVGSAGEGCTSSILPR